MLVILYYPVCNPFFFRRHCTELFVCFALRRYLKRKLLSFHRQSVEHRPIQECTHLLCRNLNDFLLITPLLIALGLFLPQIVNLLYTPEFMAAVPMSLCALFYMFFKALTSPIAYLALAHGDSLRYLTVECVYDVAFVALVVAGYSAYGLAGAGCALSAAGLFDFLLILTAYSWHYKFRFELRTLRRALLQGVCLAVGVAAAWSESLTVKYGLGGLALLSSAAYSWRLLSHETDLVRKLRGYLTKFSRKS